MIAVVGNRSLATDGTVAKKKTNPDVGTTPNAARKQLVPLTKVEREVAECKAFLAEISAVIDDAAQAGVESLDIDGAMKLQRAIELVQTFSDNVLHSWRKAKREASLRDAGEE